MPISPRSNRDGRWERESGSPTPSITGPAFDAATRREAVRIAGGRIPLEVSGGVDLATLRGIAEDGVDCISIGGLTKHVHAIDLSLKLGPVPGSPK